MTLSVDPVKLRTSRWYDGRSRDNYIHRSWMKRGLPDDAFEGKPMIGICNSASDLAPCNQHLRDLAELRQARRLGVGWRAIGVSRDLARRGADPAHGHAAPQPDGHGRRGVDPGQPDRWCRAARRLRQDHPGDGDGRSVGRHPGDRAHWWPDAERAPSRSASRFGDGCLADERAGARRHRSAPRRSWQPSR